MLFDYIPVCRLSWKDAKNSEKKEWWLKSHKENIRCANVLETLGWNDYYRALEEPETLEEIVEDFGYERIAYVLAYTMNQMQDEISDENVLFACEYMFFEQEETEEKHWEEFRIHCDVDFINIFGSDFVLLKNDQAPIMESSDCKKSTDYSGKAVAISSDFLQADYYFLEHQLYFVIYDLREKYGKLYCISLFTKRKSI